MDLSQANRLAEMALDMTERPDLQHTLERIMSNARTSISCDAAGILLLSDGRIETAASTDSRVAQSDDLQTECGEGPCLQASARNDVLVIDDTARVDRWPCWGRRVSELGWRSMLSIPMATPVRALGTLNLYSRTPGAFGADQVELGRIFGRHALVALRTAQYSDSIRAAVTSRHVIGQAQGILMERYQVDADRAFTVLRRYSQERNTKLRAIAEQVIATHRLPE